MTFALPSGEIRINGKKVRTEKTVPVISPTTEETIGEICIASEKDVALAVEAADEAFKTWRSVSLDHRISYLRRFREQALKKLEELAWINAYESGKPLLMGIGDAAFGCVANAKYHEMFAKDFLREREIPHPFPFNLIHQLKKTYRVFSPLGAIAVISPWNVPLFLSLAHIIPALIAGNTVVFKPSAYSSFVSLKAYEMFEEAGLPPGVLNVVTGTGPETGTYLTRSKVRKVSFTGSSLAGKKVLENCAGNLIPASLELGGDNASIVLRDADLDRAASGAVFGAFWNSGQICMSTKRVLVAREIKEEFVRKVVKMTRKLKVGDPFDADTDIGPLMFKHELDNMDRFVQDAVAKGAKLECGGRRLQRKGYYYEPTVLSNAKMSMVLACEEVFGPVMSIFEFETEEEAIAMANYPEYGLSAAVWSRDIRKAKDVARRLEAGQIWINDTSFIELYSPYGGVKKSGFGRTLAKEGLRDFTMQKSITVYTGRLPLVNPAWFPWTETSIRDLVNGIKLFCSDGLRGKLTTLIAWLKAALAHEKEYRDFTK